MKNIRVIVLPLFLLVFQCIILFKYGYSPISTIILGISLYMCLIVLIQVFRDFENKTIQVNNSFISELKSSTGINMVRGTEKIITDDSWGLFSVGIRHSLIIQGDTVQYQKRINKFVKDLGYLPLFLGFKTKLERQIEQAIKQSIK